MSSHEELFHRLLDQFSALLASPESAGVTIPDDELHREIIVPLLPAMLGDKSIRQHWSEQAATGFPARLARHIDGGDPAPRWLPGDFEIHVTASYSAGADARALADTLLSEDSMRDMTAALMNQLLDVLWPSLAAAPSAIAASEITVPAVAKIPVPIIPPEPEPVPALPVEIPEETLPPAIPPLAGEPEVAVEIQPMQQPPSRALVGALCRNISASAFQRGLAAKSAPWGGSAAIVARRILQSAAISPRRLPRRASL